MATHTLAALAAARSAILLHRSSWLDGLCFCGISLYDDDVNDRKLAYLRQDNCAHVNHHFRNETFLLLAILLAELAVGVSIQVHASEPGFAAGELQFEIPEAYLLPGCSGRMNWDTLSELLGERMYEVPEQFVSVEYLEAMEYCYELSQRLRKREFVNDDLDVCIAKIEIP
jgi:hypothetical protein